MIKVKKQGLTKKVDFVMAIIMFALSLIGGYKREHSGIVLFRKRESSAPGNLD